MAASVGYDPVNHILEIEFKKDHEVYQYHHVPEFVYQELIKGAIGKFFQAHILGKYNETKVSQPSSRVIPKNPGAPSIVLYDFKSDNIHSNIVARFENDNLLIDGYDIGKLVEEIHGNAGYEYVLTIKAENIPALGNLFPWYDGTQQSLLNQLAMQFKGSECFSDIEKFLTEKGVPFERFTWI